MTQDTPNGTHAKSSILKFRVEDDLAAALAELAARNERTTAGEARLALKNHLRRAKVFAGTEEK